MKVQANVGVYFQIVQESVPIQVEGHDGDVEVLVACESGGLIASLCLQGQIKTWDSYTGERLTTIDRERR